jgi:hypothetical protein
MDEGKKTCCDGYVLGLRDNNLWGWDIKISLLFSYQKY